MTSQIDHDRKVNIFIKALTAVLAITFLWQGILWAYPDYRINKCNGTALAQKTLATTEDKITSFESVALADINTYIFGSKRATYTLATIVQNLWPNILSLARARGLAESQTPRISGNDYISDGHFAIMFASGYEALFYDPSIFTDNRRRAYNLGRGSFLNIGEPGINHHLSVQYSYPKTAATADKKPSTDKPGLTQEPGLAVDEAAIPGRIKIIKGLLNDPRINDIIKSFFKEPGVFLSLIGARPAAYNNILNSEKARFLPDIERIVEDAFRGEVRFFYMPGPIGISSGVYLFINLKQTRGVIMDEENESVFGSEERALAGSDKGLEDFLKKMIMTKGHEDARQGLFYGYPRQDVLDMIEYKKLRREAEEAGFGEAADPTDKGVQKKLKYALRLDDETLAFLVSFYESSISEGDDEHPTADFRKIGFDWVSIRPAERDRAIARYLEILTAAKRELGIFEGVDCRDFTRLNERGERKRLADLGSLYSQEQIDRIFRDVLTSPVISEYHLSVHSTLGEIFRRKDIPANIKKDLHDILIDEYIKRFYAIAIDPETREFIRVWHTFGEESPMMAEEESYPEEYEISLVERFFREVLGFEAFSNTMHELIRKKQLNILHIEDAGGEEPIFDGHASPEFGINVCSSCPDDLIGPTVVHELMAYMGFRDDKFNEKVSKAYAYCRKIWNDSPGARIVRQGVIDDIRKLIEEHFTQQADEASAELREDEVFDILDIGLPKRAGVTIAKLEPFTAMSELGELDEVMKSLVAVYEGGGKMSRASKAMLEVSNSEGLVRVQKDLIAGWIPRLVATCAFGGPTMQWEAEQYLVKIIDNCTAIPLDDIFLRFQLQDIEILGHRMPGENEILGNLEVSFKKAYLDEWSSLDNPEAILAPIIGDKKEDEPRRMERMVKDIAILSRRGRYFDLLDQSKFPDAPLLAGLAYRKAYLLFQEYMRLQATAQRDLVKDTGFILNRYDLKRKDIGKEITSMLITVSDNIERFSRPPFGITIDALMRKYIDTCRLSEALGKLKRECEEAIDSPTPDMSKINRLRQEMSDIVSKIGSLEKDFTLELLKVSVKPRDWVKLAGSPAESPAAAQPGKAMNIINLPGLPGQTLPTLDELDIKIEDLITTMSPEAVEPLVYTIESVKPDSPEERAGDIRLNIETIFCGEEDGTENLQDVFCYLIGLADRDPEFRKLLLAALRSPPNAECAIVFATSKNLPVDSARYFDSKRDQAIIVFNDKFFDLVRRFKDDVRLRDAACHVVGERLLHELRHRNWVSSSRAAEVKEEVRVIKNNDMQFWKVTENIGMLDKIDELRKRPGVREAMHHSGAYFKEIRGFANRAYGEDIEDELRKFVEKYMVALQPAKAFNVKALDNLKVIEQNAEIMARPLVSGIMAWAQGAAAGVKSREERKEDRAIILDMPEGQAEEIKGLIERHIIKPLTAIEACDDETIRANIKNLSIVGRDKIGVIRQRIAEGRLKGENIIIVTSEASYGANLSNIAEFKSSFITALSNTNEEGVYYPYLEAAFFAIMRVLDPGGKSLLKIYEHIPNVESMDEEAMAKLCFDDDDRPNNLVVLKLLPKPVKFDTKELEKTYERIEEFLRKA